MDFTSVTVMEGVKGIDSLVVVVIDALVVMNADVLLVVDTVFLGAEIDFSGLTEINFSGATTIDSSGAAKATFSGQTDVLTYEVLSCTPDIASPITTVVDFTGGFVAAADSLVATEPKSLEATNVEVLIAVDTGILGTTAVVEVLDFLGVAEMISLSILRFFGTSIDFLGVTMVESARPTEIETVGTAMAELVETTAVCLLGKTAVGFLVVTPTSLVGLSEVNAATLAGTGGFLVAAKMNFSIGLRVGEM